MIVTDLRLAGGSGIVATREIRARRPETRVLMLTSFADDRALFASIMAGASGYVLKLGPVLPTAGMTQRTASATRPDSGAVGNSDRVSNVQNGNWSC